MAWVDIPDFGQGLNYDGSPEELAIGVASGERNVRFRAGYAERFHGIQSVFNAPLVTPYAIKHYTVGTTRYIVYPGLAKTYVDDGATRTEITNGARTGGIDDRWCCEVFNGVYIQNNGVDTPQYWGGTGTLTNFSAWPAGYSVGWMRPFGNNIMTGDVTRSGVRERGTVFWSHTADPGTMPTSWDIADPTKDAGDFPLSETNGTLIDGMSLGDIFAIYKDDAIHYAQRTGDNNIFRFGRLPGDTGLVARGCVVQYPGGHVYLAPNFDVLTHSGQGISSILEGKFKKWLPANINGAYAQRSFLVHQQLTNEVLICFPDGANTVCTKALVWNYKDNTFAVRDLPNVTYGSVGQVNLASGTTWATIATTWATEVREWASMGSVANAPRLIFANSSAFGMFDSTEQDLGSDFNATWERVGMFFDPQVKVIRGFRPKFDAAIGAQIKIQVGAQMLPNADPIWSAPVTYTHGTDTQANVFSVAGRGLALRIYTTDGTRWRIRSGQLDVVPQGAW